MKCDDENIEYAIELATISLTITRPHKLDTV